MQVTIETTNLKDLTSKAFKGSGRMPIIAITMFIGIEVKDGDLILTTTDRITNLKVIGKGLAKGNENFYTCVDSDLFNKLVAKTTSPTITLEATDNCLTFKGNGVYSLPIAVDEKNNVVRIAETPISGNSQSQEVDVAKLKEILVFNKPSVAKTMEAPYLTGYYLDEDAVVSFNLVTACVNKQSLLKSKVLLPANLVELFNIITVDKAMISIDDKRIMIEAGDVLINGSLMENVNEYPAQALKDLVAAEFESQCELNKNELLNTLDRLSLFISDDDKNALRLTFGEDCLTISSKKSNGNELLKYSSSSNVKPFTQLVDLVDLKNQLQTQTGETVNLLFGNEKGLMIKTNTVSQLIPFMDEE